MSLFSRLKRPTDRQRIVVPPYSILSAYYDEIMSHVDYDLWAGYAIRAARKHKKEIRTVTDLACGTGMLAGYIAEWGFEVNGLDGCEEMIVMARQREYPSRWNIRFQVCDLRQVPPVEKQDLVLCLYDSMNYLTDKDDLAAFFDSAARTVSETGLLLIDCSTEQNSLNHFDGYENSEICNDALIWRKAYYDPSERIQNNVFEIYPGNDDRMYFEHHCQRIWSIDFIRQMLEDHGFNLLGIYDRYSFKPGSELSDRVHFVARLK